MDILGLLSVTFCKSTANSRVIRNDDRTRLDCFALLRASQLLATLRNNDGRGTPRPYTNRPFTETIYGDHLQARAATVVATSKIANLFFASNQSRAHIFDFGIVFRKFFDNDIFKSTGGKISDVVLIHICFQAIHTFRDKVVDIKNAGGFEGSVYFGKEVIVLISDQQVVEYQNIGNISSHRQEF